MSNTIAITGAGSEIGKAIITALDGTCDLFILQCNTRRNELEEFCMGITTQTDIVQVDFKNDEQLNKFCTKISKADILLNIAAVTKTDILSMMPDEDINNMLRVNIYALIKICQSVIPYMISKRKGIIVNFSSIAASRGNRGQSVYAGTKGFIESFSRSLTSEVGTRGVRVNCIAPGPIDAGSLKSLMNYASDELKSSILSKRLGTPNDVASLVKYLCSDESEFMNGQVLHLDGGFLKGVS